MSQNNLSPDVRHRLWQCYSLLLSLAEEAEEQTTENNTGQESTLVKIGQAGRPKLNGSGVKQEESIVGDQPYLSNK
ncbi:MAG: hypothetical protein JXM69_17915 [Anaerolineae bacterium]|nr:hypothetical protein [Anaerolineae bacterium]